MSDTQPTSELAPEPRPHRKPRGRKAGKKAVPNETPRAKSVRLANHRVNIALSRLRLIGNLGARTYELSESDKERICDILREAFDEMKQRLANKSSKADRFEIK